MKVISFASAQNIGRISSALRSRLPLSSSTSSVVDTFTKHDKFVPFTFRLSEKKKKKHKTQAQIDLRFIICNLNSEVHVL